MQVVAPNYRTSGSSALKSRAISFFIRDCGSHEALGSIKARFLQLGYLEEDVNQLRRHREVRTSKPMSDRGKSARFLPFPLIMQRA